MKIAYVNANYQLNHTGGGHVHMEQFIANAIALGHEIWTYPGNKYPGVHIIPTDRFNHIRTMRQMDALYVRLENQFPRICAWAIPPRRLLYGFPLVVWEFNTIPEDAIFWNDSTNAINRIIDNLKFYGRGCDLAICVAHAVELYVKEKLHIDPTLLIPNGSDPDLFNPDALIPRRMEAFKDTFNVVWIGSAKIKYHDFETIRKSAELLWNRPETRHIAIHIIGPDFNNFMTDMPPNVFYWGGIEYLRLPNWLAAMDVGLYVTKGGSSTYGSPLKVFDYLASGLALVSTTHPAIMELMQQSNQSDLMIPTGDDKALTDVLINLASNPERVRQLGMTGRQLVIDQYNWRQSVKNTLDEMESLLQKKLDRK